MREINTMFRPPGAIHAFWGLIALIIACIATAAVVTPATASETPRTASIGKQDATIINLVDEKEQGRVCDLSVLTVRGQHTMMSSPADNEVAIRNCATEPIGWQQSGDNAQTVKSIWWRDYSQMTSTN